MSEDATTVKVAPLPPPDPYERVVDGLRLAARFASKAGTDIESAITKLIAHVERKRQEQGRAA